MRSSLFLLALAAVNGVAAGIIPSQCPKCIYKPDNVASYLNAIQPVAKCVLKHKLAGPAIDGDPGVVITIIPPDGSDLDSDFYVYWLRDACIAYHAWIAELEIAHHTKVPVLRKMVDDFVHVLIRTQHVDNPSGNIFSGGLEEPLFDRHIHKITRFRSRIGPPAADGPPLRAIVMLKYAEWLLRPGQNNGTWVADVLWPAIDLDLQWISTHWNKSSWDLWWDPVWGGSYWTASVQYRALIMGARVAKMIGRETDDLGYRGTAKCVLEYCQTFWNDKLGFMTETTVTNLKKDGRSGYGAAPLTVSVFNFDPTLGCDPKTFQPCSDRALSSLKVVGDAFRESYPINKKLPPDQFPYYGMFLEDQLNGGQPQFFASLNEAEQIYDALLTWDRLGKLEVTSVSLKFFRIFKQDIEIGVYSKKSDTYNQLTGLLQRWADNTVTSLAKRTPPDCMLPLGMTNDTGVATLPWGALRTQVAVMGCHNSYYRVVPPSWYKGTPGSRKLLDSEETSDVGYKPCHGDPVAEPDDESQFGFEFEEFEKLEGFEGFE